MDNIVQNKANLQSLLLNATSIGIIASERQNIDVLSAAISLHLIFQDSGKSSQIISKKDPIVEHSFLVGIDQLKKSFGGLTKNLTVSFPYVEGEIEKVSYNIEGDRLNVNLFGTEQGIKFDEKAVKYLRQGSSPQVIITVGITNPQEIEGLVESGAQIINIDNSVNNALFGNIVLVDPSYSSLSEIVSRMAVELGLTVEFDVAQNLLDGISFATTNFTSPKTSPLAFEMTGVLMQKGAIRKNMKEAVGRASQDTSLSMLNKKPAFNSQSNNTSEAVQQPTIQNQQFQAQPVQNASQFEESFTQQPVQNNHVSERVSSASQPAQSAQAPVQDAPIDPIPSEDEAPSDWFIPKVFKSNKTQD